MTTPQPNPTDDLEALKQRALKRAPVMPNGNDRKLLYALVEALDERLRPAGVGEAVAWPEREKDLRWLEWQKETGHCGESTSEAIQRGRINACIDRILAAVATPPQPDAALMERVRTVLDDAIKDELGDNWRKRARALLSDLKAEAGR